VIAILILGLVMVGEIPPPPPRPHWERAVASFYGYGGASEGACGELRADGVASRTMACGTRLVICAGRCATATVDDRGPYVAGRVFDLSESLASAAGFPFAAGVATVRWHYAKAAGHP
jgi:rare lipoprotein A (peptidoglycan hydrolase)